MTTIAWDGKTLAVDSLATCNEIISSYNEEKLFLNVGVYSAVAIAGNFAEMLELVEWLKTKDGEMPKANGTAMCVKPDGCCFSYHPKDGCSRPDREDNLAASGTGWEIAIGALEAGCDAVRAVEIAIKRDPFSGGKIQMFSLEEAPARLFSVEQNT